MKFILDLFTRRFLMTFSDGAGGGDGGGSDGGEGGDGGGGGGGNGNGGGGGEGGGEGAGSGDDYSGWTSMGWTGEQGAAPGMEGADDKYSGWQSLGFTGEQGIGPSGEGGYPVGLQEAINAANEAKEAAAQEATAKAAEQAAKESAAKATAKAQEIQGNFNRDNPSAPKGSITADILAREEQAAIDKARAIPGAYTKSMEAEMTPKGETPKGLGITSPEPQSYGKSKEQLESIMATRGLVKTDLEGITFETAKSLGLVNEAGVSSELGKSLGLPSVAYPDAYLGNTHPAAGNARYDSDGKLIGFTESALNLVYPSVAYNNIPGVEATKRDLVNYYKLDKVDALGRVIPQLAFTEPELLTIMFDKNPWMTPYDYQIGQGVYTISMENMYRLVAEGKKYIPSESDRQSLARRGVNLDTIDRLTKEWGLVDYGNQKTGYEPDTFYSLVGDVVNYEKYNVPRDVEFTRLAEQLRYLLNAEKILSPNQVRDLQVKFAGRVSEAQDKYGAVNQMIVGALTRGTELGFDNYVSIGGILRPVNEVENGRWVGKEITAAKEEINSKVPFFLNPVIDGKIETKVAPANNPAVSFYQIPGQFQNLSEIPMEEIRDHNDFFITAMVDGLLTLISTPAYAFDVNAKISVLPDQTRYETGDVVRITFPVPSFQNGKTEIFGVEFDKKTGVLTGISRGGDNWELASNSKPINEADVVHCTTDQCSYEEATLGKAILEVRELGIKGLITPWGHPEWADKKLPGMTFINPEIKEKSPVEISAPKSTGFTEDGEIYVGAKSYNQGQGTIVNTNKGWNVTYKDNEGWHSGGVYETEDKAKLALVSSLKETTKTEITPTPLPEDKLTSKPEDVFKGGEFGALTTEEPLVAEVPVSGKDLFEGGEVGAIQGGTTESITGLSKGKQKSGFEPALAPSLIQPIKPLPENTPVLPSELSSKSSVTVGDIKKLREIMESAGGVYAYTNVAAQADIEDITGMEMGFVPKGPQTLGYDKGWIKSQVAAIKNAEKYIENIPPSGQLSATTMGGLKTLWDSGYTIYTNPIKYSDDIWIFRPDGKLLTEIPDLSLVNINKLSAEFDKTKQDYDVKSSKYEKSLNELNAKYEPFIKEVMINEDPVTHQPIYGKQWTGTEERYRQYLDDVSEIEKEQIALKPAETKLNNQYEILTLSGAKLESKNPVAQMANAAEDNPGKFIVGFIPGVGTAVLWNEMDTTGKVISIGTDILSLVGAGLLGKSMIKAGISPWIIARDVILDATILPRSFNPVKDIPLIRLPSGFRTLETEVEAIANNQAKVEQILKTSSVIQQRATLRGMLNPDTQKVFDATMEIMDTLGDYKAPTKQLRNVADFSVVKNMPQGAATGVKNVLGQIADIAEVRGSMADWMQLNGIKYASKPNDVDIVIFKGGRLTKQEVAKQMVDSMNQSAGKTVAKLDNNGHTVLGNVNGKWEKTLDIHYVGDFQLSESPPLGLTKNRTPVILDGIKFEPIGNQIWHRGLELIKPGTGTKLGLMGPEAFGKPWRVGDAYKFEVLVRTIIQNLKDTGQVDLAKRMESNLKAFMDAPRGKPLPWTPADLGGIDQEFAELFKELQIASLSESRSIVAIHPTKGVLVSTATPAMNVIPRTLYTGVRDIRPYINALKEGKEIPVGKILNEVGEWVDAPTDRIFTSPRVAFDRMYDIGTGEIGKHAGIIAISTVDTDIGTTIKPSFRFEKGTEFKGVKGKVFGKEFQFGKEETFPIRFDEWTIEPGQKLFPTTQSDIKIKNPVAGGLTGETVTRNPRTGDKVPMLWLTTEKAKQFGVDYADASVGMPTKAQVRAMNLLALKAKLVDILHPHLQKDIRFTTEKGVIGKSNLINFYQDNLKFVETSAEKEKLNKQLQSLVSKKELNMTKQQMAKEIADAYGFKLPEVTNTVPFKEWKAEAYFEPDTGEIAFRDDITGMVSVYPKFDKVIYGELAYKESNVNTVIHELVHRELIPKMERVANGKVKGLTSEFVKNTKEFNFAKETLENIDNDFAKNIIKDPNNVNAFHEIVDTLYIQKLTGYLDKSYLDDFIGVFEPKNKSRVLQVSQKYIDSLNILSKQDLATTISKLEEIGKKNLGKIILKSELDATRNPILNAFNNLSKKFDEALVGDLNEQLKVAHREGIKSGKSVESILDKKVTAETKQIENLINSNPELRNTITSNAKKLSDGYVVNLRTLAEKIAKGAVPQIAGAVSTVKPVSAREFPSTISGVPKVVTKIATTIPSPILPIPATIPSVKGITTVIPTSITPTEPTTIPQTVPTVPTTPTIPTTTTPTIPTTPTTPITPPITPVIPKVPPPKPPQPPKFLPNKKKFEYYSENGLPEGSLAWKQGVIYRHWFPPYGTAKESPQDWFFSRKPIPGVPYETGVGSAYASIVRLGGEIPDELHYEMGLQKLTIKKGDRGTNPEIFFELDAKDASWSPQKQAEREVREESEKPKFIEVEGKKYVAVESKKVKRKIETEVKQEIPQREAIQTEEVQQPIAKVEIQQPVIETPKPIEQPRKPEIVEEVDTFDAPKGAFDLNSLDAPKDAFEVSSLDEIGKDAFEIGDVYNQGGSFDLEPETPKNIIPQWREESVNQPIVRKTLQPNKNKNRMSESIRLIR